MKIMRLMLLLCFLSLPVFGADQFHTNPSAWKEPRPYHSDFPDEYWKKIVVSEGSGPAALLSPVHSDNSAYYFMTLLPDFTAEGPWTTTLYINVCATSSALFIIRIPIIYTMAQVGISNDVSFRIGLRKEMCKLMGQEIWMAVCCSADLPRR